MSASDEAIEWVYRRIDELTEPEPDGIQNGTGNIFTGIGLMRNDGRKDSTSVTKEEVERAVEELRDQEEILYWHGLIAPTSDEHLLAVIENERKTGFPRTGLISKANRLRAEEVAADV